MKTLCSSILMLTLSIVFTTSLVAAGCMSDCKDEYESEVESCQLLHGDEPDDAEDLRICIDNAHDEYESCTEECGS